MSTKPAIADVNDNTAAAVAGSVTGELDKSFPPIPRATRNTRRTGSHEIRSYLMNLRLAFLHNVAHLAILPIEDLVPTERDLEGIMGDCLDYVLVAYQQRY